MSVYSGLFKKSFELLECSYIVHKHLAKNYSGAYYKAGYEAGFCGLGIQCQLSAPGIECVLLICKLLYYQLFMAQLYYSTFLLWHECGEYPNSRQMCWTNKRFCIFYFLDCGMQCFFLMEILSCFSDTLIKVSSTSALSSLVSKLFF